MVEGEWKQLNGDMLCPDCMGFSAFHYKLLDTCIRLRCDSCHGQHFVVGHEGFVQVVEFKDE